MATDEHTCMSIYTHIYIHMHTYVNIANPCIYTLCIYTRYIDSLRERNTKLCHSASNLFFWCDARPRPRDADCECNDKVNHFYEVSSREDKTLAFEALESSNRGKCHFAPTEHPLLRIVDIQISIPARETCPSIRRDSDSSRQASGRSLVG